MPEAILTAISEAIASASKEIGKFAAVREKNYRKSLRVALLLTGQGESNAFGVPEPEATLAP